MYNLFCIVKSWPESIDAFKTDQAKLLVSIHWENIENDNFLSNISRSSKEVLFLLNKNKKSLIHCTEYTLILTLFSSFYEIITSFNNVFLSYCNQYIYVRYGC